MMRAATLASAIVLIGSVLSCSRTARPTTSNGVPLAGPLIPATTTMVTAWDLPKESADRRVAR